MRDLEIRGAGNLLGDEQSGHVAALGFELYMQMLDEAVARGRGRRRGREEELAEPVRLDVNVDAYVPADYVPYEQAKIDVHRRDRRRARGRRPGASCARSSRTASAQLPEPLENLLALQQARIKFGQAGARTVSFRGGPPGGHADRARLACAPSGCARSCPRRCTSRAVAALGARARGSGKRFPAVVRAADVLLAVMREAA